MKYHAHIYWNNEREKEIALSLRLTLHNSGCGLGRIMNEPVGPHPAPMYQVMYDDRNRDAVEGYLGGLSRDISILLHEDVGDNHVRDHTEGARWIGEPRVLNLEFLKRLDSPS